MFVWICQSSQDKAILWIEDLYLSNGLKLKTLSQIQRFSLDWMLTDCSLVDYYDVFISFLDSHSDGTHSL